jgi:glycosyltransferase involved in cell wall biosynthesis
LIASQQRAHARRLAVVDPVGHYGGATRFVRALLPALRKTRPELDVTFFGNAGSIQRDRIAEEFSAAGVRVHELQSVRLIPWKSRPLRTRAWYKIRRRIRPAGLIPPDDVAANLDRELPEVVGGSDVAFFPWPYGLSVPPLRCASVTTVHDLNFKYFFGAPIFSPSDSQILNDRIGEWLRKARAIASSQFMADEIARFYPSARAVAMIRLAPFSELGHDGAAEALVRLGVGEPYLLYPTHMTVHKNIGPLIAAQALIRERFPKIRLVLTGSGTEAATGRATALGSVREAPDPDVIGLGYVSNHEIDSLIDCASVVVNPSLYEAGNGPGLDAWSVGTPVAMSNIPAFTEHLSAFGVEAAVFDPRDPADIAAKISDILDRTDEWIKAARRSRAAISEYTWEHVARAYLQVFDRAYAEHHTG